MARLCGDTRSVSSVALHRSLRSPVHPVSELFLSSAAEDLDNRSRAESATSTSEHGLSFCRSPPRTVETDTIAWRNQVPQNAAGVMRVRDSVTVRGDVMSEVGVMLNLLEFVRTRTIGTLDEISKLPDPAAALRWQPGPGRAHLGWQLTHIGITEELTATERLQGSVPAFGELVPRFKIGSVPDHDVPGLDQIRQILTESRAHLIATLSEFRDDQLDVIPPWYTERGWTLRRLMQILVWHECHHQGQAHLTLNLWKAAHPAS